MGQWATHMCYLVPSWGQSGEGVQGRKGAAPWLMTARQFYALGLRVSFTWTSSAAKKCLETRGAGRPWAAFGADLVPGRACIPGPARGGE